MGFYFNITNGEWIVIILCFAIVMTAEAFNSAIEKLVDFVSPGIHPQAGKIKDIAAGAVLITAIIAAIIGCIIFIPKIIILFS
jgi:diacylglycerol kinase (ATP)